ncbi:MAG TPA: SH3 domain-containing protein [Alphaproteobacteria bacterium]|nr:SH3 domain-containing protein [Alphaproteobacteria bacterium]
MPYFPKCFETIRAVRRIVAIPLVLAFLAPVLAQGAETASPVPRFVSLRSDKVNVRSGPDVSYPIEWVLERKGMPVEIVQEKNNWRKVRDIQGTEGWVNQALLSSRRSIIVTGAVRTLREEARDSARPVARAEPDVIGQLLQCEKDWCRVEVNGLRGWLRRTEFWGVYPNETVE